jgi:phosphate transport system substrate-binding protein
VGLGGKGSEGVTGQVKQLPGAIGYVELSYANQNHLETALIKNAVGEFIAPSASAVTTDAAATLAKLPPNTDYRISIVNAKGRGAYPISSLTWILMYRHQADPVRGKRLLDFVRWGLTDGQKYEGALDYAPLPASMSKQLLKRLDGVTVATR